MWAMDMNDSASRPLDDERRRIVQAAAHEAAGQLGARMQFVALGLLLRMQGMVEELRGLPRDRTDHARRLGRLIQQMVTVSRAGEGRAREEFAALCAHFDAIEALLDENMGPRPAMGEVAEARELPAAARPLYAFLAGVVRQAALVEALGQAALDEVAGALGRNAASARAARAQLAGTGALEESVAAYLAYLEGF
jgi:hypothetical protein